jgi:hypothetical protein
MIGENPWFLAIESYLSRLFSPIKLALIHELTEAGN